MITVLHKRPLFAFPSSPASPEPSAGPALAEATGVSSGQGADLGFNQAHIYKAFL